MPFYDYECTACALEFAAFQRLTDTPYLSCPDCSGALKSRFLVEKPADKYVIKEPDWKPLMTEVHKGWTKRREWKHGAVQSLNIDDDEK